VLSSGFGAGQPSLNRALSQTQRDILFQQYPTINLAICSSVNMAASVDAKLLRQTKFPPEFNQKVDMKKVNVEVMKK
jgi:hypothetical protein